ncbi:hypothetical protein [Cupriavidus necator]
MVASGLPERVSAELQYFEVKFAAQMSYGLTVNVLQEVLPLDHVLAASSIRRQVTALGRRLEAELATDARQQVEMAATVGSPDIPEPSPVRVVGIDGGYLRLAGHRRRQDGWFGVVVLFAQDLVVASWRSHSQQRFLTIPILSVRHVCKILIRVVF